MRLLHGGLPIKGMFRKYKGLMVSHDLDVRGYIKLLKRHHCIYEHSGKLFFDTR